MLRCAAVTAAVTLVAALAPALTSAAAAADTSVNLPLGKFSALLVDQSDGLLFVAGRANSMSNDHQPGGVLVSGLNGAGLARVTGTTDAAALTLGPDGRVYVAEDSGTIAVIDPATRQVVANHPTGTAGCPSSIAFAGSELWFGYTCGPDSGDGLGQTAGVAELNTVDDTVTTNLVGRRSAITQLRSVPGHPAELIATGLTDNGDLDVLAISGTAATLGTEVDSINPADLAVSPDGASVLVANDYAQKVESRSTADLTSRPISYPTAASRIRGVAVGADGQHVAASTDEYSWSDIVTTYDVGGGQPLRSYDTSTPGSANQGQSTVPEQDGLVWTGSTLLAVYSDYANGYPVLKVLTSALQTPLSLSLSAPKTAGLGAPVTVAGTVTSNVSPAGLRLTVSKHDLAGTHVLPSVTTDSAGRFSLTDRPAVGGTVTYTVGYPGDAAHGDVSRSIAVAVARLTPTIRLGLDHTTYAYHGLVHLTAYLGSTNNVHAVSFYATLPGRPAKLLRTVPVDSSGHARLASQVTYTTLFSAVFPGDYRYAPRSATAVARTQVAVSAQLVGYKGTSGAYRLFDHRNYAGIVGAVAPNKAGRCVAFESQYYGSGRWNPSQRLSCGDLDTTSAAAAAFHGAQGYSFRLRVTYSGDSSNAAAASAWLYLRFV